MVWTILFGVFLSYPAWAGQMVMVGPGHAFQEIQSAINVASTNDIIVVDPGEENFPHFYAPITITGGHFSIVSMGGPNRPFRIRQIKGHPSITIQNTTAGESVSIYHVRLDLNRSQKAIRIQNNRGSVRLNSVSILANQDLTNFPPGGVIDIRNSSSVWAYGLKAELRVKARYQTNVEHAGIYDGVSTMDVQNSNVLLQNSTLVGTDHEGKYARGGDAIRLTQSMLRMTGYQGIVTVWGGESVDGNAGGAGIRIMDSSFGSSSAMGCSEVLAWGGGIAVNQLWGGILVHRFEPVFSYRVINGFNRWSARALPSCIEPSQSAVGGIPSLIEPGNHYEGSYLNATQADYDIIIGETQFSSNFAGLKTISQSSAGGNWLSPTQNSVMITKGITPGEITEPFDFSLPENLTALGMQLTVQALSADRTGKLNVRPLVWSDPLMVLIMNPSPPPETPLGTTK